MRVKREELLKVLESVSPGLAPREIIEQSSCIVFHDGKVMTFNDEVACSRKSPLNIEGAVKAEPLLKLLGKLSEDDIDMSVSGAELCVKGARREARFRLEAEVMLPVESVDVPDKWRALAPEFNDAINIVHACASGEESQFVLTCIHVHKNHLEACDRFQMARYPVDTGVDTPLLIRAESLKKIVGFDMTEVSETGAWIHFRNPAGLVLSCRKYAESYYNLDEFITSDGTTPVVLPGGLEEAVDKAQIFSGENAEGDLVTVNLKPDKITIQGEGASGRYREVKKVRFDGEPMKFNIAPKLLVEVTKKSNECRIGAERLFIDTGKFRYVTRIEKPDNGASNETS